MAARNARSEASAAAVSSGASAYMLSGHCATMAASTATMSSTYMLAPNVRLPCSSMVHRPLNSVPTARPCVKRADLPTTPVLRVVYSALRSPL